MWVGVLLGLAVLGVDFFSKWYVAESIPLLSSPFYPYSGIPVFQNMGGVDFAIVHATNKGAAWGALSDFQIPLLILRIALVIGLLVYLLKYNRIKAYVIPMCLVLAGAIGNIFDTFYYGQVIDMLKFVFWGYHYPVFNVADMAITLGIGWMILASFFVKDEVPSV